MAENRERKEETGCPVDKDDRQCDSTEKLVELKNIDGEINQNEKGALMSRKTDLTKDDFNENLSNLIYDDIKKMKLTCSTDKEVFDYFLSDKKKSAGDNIINNIIKSLNIKSTSQNIDSVLNCLIVIVHALTISYSYKKLVNDVKEFKGVSRNIAKKHVVRYIEALQKKKKIDLSNWLPEKRHIITQEEIDNWVKLFKENGNVSEVLRILAEKGLYVPAPNTFVKKVSERMGLAEYKNKLKRKVDWVERTPYEEIQRHAEQIGIQEVGIAGGFKTSKEEYETALHPYEEYFIWVCGKCGVEFNQSIANVKTGSWCEICKTEQRRIEMIKPYEEIQEAVRKVGIEKTGYPGKFKVSREKYYKKRKTAPLKTKFWHVCGKCLHRWKATPEKIIYRRQWCPLCSQSYSEKVCRGFFERILKRKFPNTPIVYVMRDFGMSRDSLLPYFPEDLWEDVKNLIENGHFDGYNKFLKLAFERNGEHHYKFIKNYFHQHHDDFLHQQKIDKIKIKIANILGLRLIIVPYTIEYDEMQRDIVEKYEAITNKVLPKMKTFNYKKFFIPSKKHKIYPIKDTFTEKDLKELATKDKKNKVIIVDIETTGGNKSKDKIVEIGIVELDIKTGNIKIIFNSLIKENGFTVKRYLDSYGLKKSGISPYRIEQLKNHSIDDFRKILKLIFDNYKVASWAINNFDFSWFQSRDFNIPYKLIDIQKFAKEAIKKRIEDAPYNLQYAWHFFRESRKNQADRAGRIILEEDYTTSHRAIDDAWHEAKILYFLIKAFNFPIEQLQQNNDYKELDAFFSSD